jgi:hypothetical protein
VLGTGYWLFDRMGGKERGREKIEVGGQKTEKRREETG